MKNIYFSVVILIGLTESKGDSLPMNNSDLQNNTRLTDYLEDVEVPDSALLTLNRINLRKLSAAKYYDSKYSRSRKQQNGTTDTEESEETSLTPCTCVLGVCKCCTGYVLDLFKQKACMKITYHPGDFAFDVSMSMNDRILYENSLSGRNPTPICISPPRLTNMKVCAKFYNVFFPGRNFHFCLAMNGQWRQFELFNMAFNCLRMGANGIAVMRPDENGGIEIPNPQGGVDAVIDSGTDDIEDYDENLVKSLFSVFDDDR